MVYLSSSRLDCDCKCYIPEIPYNNTTIWRNGLSIINIGNAVASSDENVDYISSLHVSLPFFLYLHIGFASKLFEDANMDVQFILMIVGKSGSLKTSICKTFAEPFNLGGMLRLESTSRALELYREECIDMTMLADDIFNQRKDFLKSFEEILRAFGDTIGRAKSGGMEFNSIRRSKVRGGCIITSEHDLDTQQSSTLRYITLSIDSDSIRTDVLKYFQDDQKLANQRNYPSIVQSYFAAWIDFLEKYYYRIVGWLISFNPPYFSLKFKRQFQSYKVFCAIAYLILKWGLEIGAINQDQFDTHYETWISVIQRLMLINQDMAIGLESWQQFLLTLQESIATGELCLAGNKKEFDNGKGQFFGYYRTENDEKQLVLNPGKVFDFVKTKIRKDKNSFVSEATPIFRDLFNQKISYGYRNQNNKNATRNRYFKRIKVNGHLIEMLVISINSMENAIQKILREEEK